MTHDPVHPAQEPEYPRKAVRCGAKTRSGKPCRSPAVAGKGDAECTVAREGLVDLRERNGW
jgi:hypothetical protein